MTQSVTESRVSYFPISFPGREFQHKSNKSFLEREEIVFYVLREVCTISSKLKEIQECRTH